MLSLIVGANLIRDVVNGCRKQVQVVEKHRCGENQTQIYAAATKRVVSVGGHNVAARLYGITHVVVFLFHVGKQSDVGIGSSCGVMHVVCDNIVANTQTLFYISRQHQLFVLHPRFTRLDCQNTIYVHLTLIIVRVNQPQVARQVFFGQRHMPTYIDVRIGVRPNRTYVRIFFGRAKRRLLCLPFAVVKIALHPVRSWFCIANLCLPRAHVGHWCHGFQ